MKHLVRYFQIVFVVLGINLTCFAESYDVLVSLRGDHTYEQYYEIQHHQGQAIDLLDWQFMTDPDYSPPEPYNRNAQFEGWIQDPSHNSCFDTRNLVLLRQAMEPVQIDGKNSCRILSSSWYDPYTDQYFHLASDLQIDHVVPLKNAYLAGAWAWSRARRCNYSNFMGFANHLIAVEKHANMSKGDRGPDAYLPVNTQYQCFYLAAWLRIKAIWDLKIAMPEASAIQQFIKVHNCPSDVFSMDEQEYIDIRIKSEEAPEACASLSPIQ